MQIFATGCTPISPALIAPVLSRYCRLVVEMISPPAHTHEKRMALRLVVGTVFGEEREVSRIWPARSHATHISGRERFGKNAFHPDRIMDLRIDIRPNFPHARTITPPYAAFISRKHGMIAVCSGRIELCWYAQGESNPCLRRERAIDLVIIRPHMSEIFQ